MNRMNCRRLVLAGVLLLPFLASCVSQRGYQQAIDQKDAEIRDLREERAKLKSQIQGLKSSLDTAQTDIQNAGATTGARSGEPELDKKFPELDSLGIGYGMRDGNMVISIPSSITFPSGQSTLSKEGQKALDKVAATLKKQYPSARYSIEGHTDSDPIKKSKFTSNRDLSVQRALAVLTFLVEECSIKDDQCIVAGHGQYDPIAPNDNKDDKTRNRRVEIVVHRQK